MSTTTTNSSSTNAGSALAASIHGTPAATLLDEGFSYATRKEFLTYLESNAVTTRTSFNTMKVSEYKNWLIFPNEKPRAPVGNTNHSSIIHISIWNVSFSILIGQNSVAEWLSG
jgi:hypothetical protein